MNLNRFTQYAWSTPNIAGSTLAAVGLGLNVAGLVPIGGPLIAIALYGAGAFAGFGLGGSSKLSISDHKDSAAVKRELDKVVQHAKKDLPDDMDNLLDSIQGSINLILDRTHGGTTAGDPILFSVRRTALDYLPETLNAYFDLPSGYATRHTVKIARDASGGKIKMTSYDVLAEQLNLLDKQMMQIVEDVLEGDSQKLISHGNFLMSRFGQNGDRSLQMPAEDDD